MPGMAQRAPGPATPARSSTRSAPASARRPRSSRPSLAAIEASDAQRVLVPSTADAAVERGRSRPTSSLPFGGVPVGIKELDYGRGLAVAPRRRSSSRDRTATYTSHDAPAAVRRRRRQPRRADDGVGVRRPERVDHEAQRHHPQPVAARPDRRRLVGRVGGGGRRRRSCRSPAAATAAARSASRPAFNGLLGMKGTAGRIPRGPQTMIRPLTVVRRAAWHGRSATSPAGTTSAPATTAATRTRCPTIDGWERDLGVGPRRPAGQARWRSRPTLGLGRSSGPRSRSGCGPPARPSPATPGSSSSTCRCKLPGLGTEWAIGQPGDAPRRPRRSVAGLQGRAHAGDRLRPRVRRPGDEPRDGGAAASWPASTPTRRWPRCSTRSTSSSPPPTPTSPIRPR